VAEAIIDCDISEVRVIDNVILAEGVSLLDTVIRGVDESLIEPIKVSETRGLELFVTKLLAVWPVPVGYEVCVTYASVAVEHPLKRAVTETLFDTEDDGLNTGDNDEILLGNGEGDVLVVSVPKK
jgi:hypothetical protein